MSRRIFLLFHGRFPSEKAAALFALQSAEAFKNEGYAVTVLAPRRLGSGRGSASTRYLPTLDLFGILPAQAAFLLSFFAFSISAYMYLLLRAPRDAIIYSNESLPLFLATFSFPNTVYELHDYPGQYRWLYRALFRRVRGMLVTNRIKVERLIREFVFEHQKILVEPNAVSLEQFSTPLSRREAREALNLSLDDRVVVYTGHLYAWKGVDTLARAFSSPSFPPKTFIYLVGGTEEDSSRMKQQYPHLANTIIGHRPHDEMPLWQKAADVLVLPNTARERISAEDTSPMKLFEYMASGTPIVASRLPSIVEIADDSRALLVAPDDPQALAQGIEKALTDTAGAAARAAAARAWVAEHTWEKRARRILAWVATLPNRSEKFSHERIIFAASFLAPLLFIGIFMATHGSAQFGSLSSDGYIPLAVSLFEHGTFTYSTTTPYVLEAAHTPGYPLFLSLTAVPWGSILPALLLQALLFAYAAVLLYRLFEGVFSSRVRFFGALVFGIEPYTAYTVAQPLSEALFLALFIGGLLLARRAFENEKTGLLFLSGIFLASAAAVRPIALYLIPLAVLTLLSIRMKKRLFVWALVFAAGASLVLLPWMYRNEMAFGTWSLSTKGPYTLYFYDAGELLKYREGISGGAAYQELLARVQATYPEVKGEDELRSPKYNAFFTDNAIAIIRQSPGLFIKMYAVSLATFFLSDGYRLLWYEMSNGAITLPNITRAITTGDANTVWSYFASQPLQAVLFVFGFVFWSLAFLLAAVGAIAGLYPRRVAVRLAVLASITLIAYFALLTGPVAQARYRIVVTPFLLTLASYGAAVLTSHFYARR